MGTDQLSTTFAALADPTRRAILARLATGERTVTEFAEPFAMRLPAVSKHLKVLENAGLIARGREAQWRPCRLEGEPLREVADWVERYRRFWEESFDRLDAYLKDLQRDEKKHGPEGQVVRSPPRHESTRRDDTERTSTMTTANTTTRARTADRDLVLTRIFDAPRRLERLARYLNGITST